MIKQILNIEHLNFDQFHFLRPELLWAFIPMLVMIIIAIISNRRADKWKQIIAPSLHKFMFTKSSKSSMVLPIAIYTLILSLSIIAISGPTWYKVKMPKAKNEATLTIAIDLSLSMLGTDIQPNRLERAKFKIMDLLQEDPLVDISLIGFSGTAHLIVPFCDDYSIIEHHLKSLSPGIMPLQGTDISTMLSIVDSTMSHIIAPSRILLITDVIDQDDAILIEEYAKNSIHTLELFPFSTSAGSSIQKNSRGDLIKDHDGYPVISNQDLSILNSLKSSRNIIVNYLTLDKSDIKLIAERSRDNLYIQEDKQKEDDEWMDMGAILLIIIMPLLLLWFRKGWMVQLLVIFSLTSCNNPKWIDLWNSKDYQAQKLYDQGQFTEAADLYQSNIHKGVALFRSGNYDAAAFAFEQDSSSISLYNLSLSYTKLGRYDDALKAVEQAIASDPTNQEFKEMLNQTEQLIMVVDSLNINNEEIITLNQEEKPKGELKERDASGPDEKLSADNETDELPEDGDRLTDEVDSGIRKAEEMEEVPDDFESGSSSMPNNVMLREISEDPAVFLKRRFKFQYNRDFNNKKTGTKIW